MRIRLKITLQFCAIVGLILILFSVSIYYFSKQYRYNAFNIRLKEKALNTANLLIEVNEIDVNLLKKLRKNYFQSLPEEFVRIYDKNNLPVFVDDSVQYIPDTSYFNKVRSTGELDFEQEERQFVAILFKEQYIIIASAKNTNGTFELNYLSFLLISGNIICLLLLLFFGRFFAKQALNPISSMIKQVESIEETNLNSRLDEGSKKDEIAQLAITFNKLFQRIGEAFERQKRFVSNASHELRTPLTAITGEIEVALMKKRNPEQYIEVLESVLEETKILTRLSNNLLMLTQAQDAKGLLIEKIGLLELINTIAEESKRRNEALILKFEFKDIDKLEDKYIEGNVELLKIAFLNILENAYKFSEFKPVEINISSDEKFIIIKIIDKGIGMSKEDIEFIFQPFYRSENVSSIEGSGIGLSLTQRIIKLHNGALSVTSKLEIGTEVMVALPMEINS